jgi:FKBP-type peptidyl-prolyl cis-trans isomerase FkpA
MKRLFFAFSLLLVLTSNSGCIKDEGCNLPDVQTIATPAEIAEIQSFLTSNGITNAIQHPTGVFYVVNTTLGGTQKPDLCNYLVVTYEMYRLGYPNPIDSYSEPAGRALRLGELILGVQKVGRLLGENSSVTMYIPPSLGYGAEPIEDDNGNILLPGNSFLRFNVNVLGIR